MTDNRNQRGVWITVLVLALLAASIYAGFIASGVIGR